jgi:hypothetical protein
VLANAVSQALNDAWSRSDVDDAVVAVPTKFLASDFFEFGDGQANAAPSFPWWGESRPQLVATLLRLHSGTDRVVFRFDHALPYPGTAFELAYAPNRQRPLRTVPLTATRDAAGDAILEWQLPQDFGFDGLTSTANLVVHPVGWQDWFTVWFRMPVKPIAALRLAQPRFSDGRSIVDREGIADAARAAGSSPFAALSAHAFSARYNGQGPGSATPFVPADIHAVFPYNRQNLTTAVGKGWTWVADERPSGYKVMYTCFEARNPAAEAAAPTGGVPSGGGWHQINDAAETILNDLEGAPLVVASGMANPWLESALPSGAFSYGLTDVITVRWLRAGEAFMTVKGSWVTDGNGRWYDQSNYHWYFFDQPNNVCTEEIVNAPGTTSPGNFDL